jgi:hypothetical protein
MSEKLTTAQAAHRAKASRFVLMRAKKAGHLNPIRDNRGGLLWDAAELDAWAVERGAHGAHTVRESAPADDAAHLRTALDAERLARAEAETRAAIAEGRAAAAEAERDRWHAMADKLAARPRWWPW